MRTEQEMMALILRVAAQDERVRAVALNGSRANPKAPKDLFQDYDVVYIVREMASFLADPGWVDVFGERIIMQMPDAMASVPVPQTRFSYLMLFTDGNRIDLRLLPLGEAQTYAQEDRLTVVLLDKDHLMPDLPAPVDEHHRVQPPTAQLYDDCCNEFWWVAPYVAKGLWRRQILYARWHLDFVIRPMLLRMLEWNAGVNTGFSARVGRFDKYLERYLDSDSWQALLATYSDADYERTWDALFAACDLFDRIGKAVASHFGFTYPLEDGERVAAFLARVRTLPPTATQFD